MSTSLNLGKVLILLFILTIPSFIHLMRPGYFSMQDDVQAFRLFEFDKCVKTLQLPCRWIPDGGSGYGYPLFNYYPPLPYAVGEFFHLLGLSILDSVKALFIIGFIGSAFGIFLLVFNIWGIKAGLLSSIFYLYAPYRSVDAFVRGALSEFWGLALAPFILWGILGVIRSQKAGGLILATSLTALLLTHLLTLLVLIPFLLIWTLFWLWQEKRPDLIIKLSLSSLIALGLSAFYWLPSLAEKNLVTLNTTTQGYFNYLGHFASLDQLFLSRFWGYGASLFQRSDMSLSVGILQWLVPSIVLMAVIIFKKKKVLLSPFFFLSVFFGFFYAFMAHNQSTTVWQALPFLAFLQFPWRFVGLSVLAFALALGAVRIRSHFLLVLLVFSVMILNVGYFREDLWFPDMTDAQKLSPTQIERQNISGLKDYWPNFGTSFPTHQAPNLPLFIRGTGQIDPLSIGSDSYSYSISSRGPATVEFPVVYFPDWEVTNQTTGQTIPIKITQPLGLISASLPEGTNQVELKLKNTPVRSVANIISLVSVLVLIICLKKLL